MMMQASKEGRDEAIEKYFAEKVYERTDLININFRLTY